MVRSLCTLILLSSQAFAQSPQFAFFQARADCERLPPAVRARVRYLALPYITDEKELAIWDAVNAFWLNSLSTEAELVKPFKVAKNLWRVDIGDYGWKYEVWEKLLETNEPYFHQRQLVETIQQITEFEEVGNYYDNFGQGKPIVITHEEAKKRIDVGWRTTRKIPKVKEVKKTSEQSVLDPTLGPDAYTLSKLTGSQIPLVRADWFIYQTAIAKNRKAGYYHWLGIGNKEADFQKLIGADVKAAQKVKRELLAVVGESSVTLNNRELQRFQGITGGYWRSRDFDDNKEFKNPLRLLDGDAKHDATEQYGFLPNGLFTFWLGDSNGNRQDAAPDNIASDSKSGSTDRRVHVGLSCIRCHEPGIQEIDDWVRGIYKLPFSLDSPDYEKQKRLRQIYLSDLQKWIKRDQIDYADTLKELNGLSSQQNSKAFAEAWASYADRKRTLGMVALELGVKEEVLREKLAIYAKGVGRQDPIIVALLQGRAIKVEHWEEVVPQIGQIVRSP